MQERHTIPTHLNVQEKISTGFIALSPKQMLLLLVGVSLTYHLWLALPTLSALGLLGLALRLLVALLPVEGVLLLGWITWAGRGLDLWGLLLLFYLVRPKDFLWQSVHVHDPAALPLRETNEQEAAVQ